MGVTIHIGTADAGHYYSYININRGAKEKDPDDPTWAETENEPWKEFNDSHVKEYKFSDLKLDCFGGSSGNEEMGGWFKSSSQSYGKSAYMLVYEKRRKDPLKVLELENSLPAPECDTSAPSRGEVKIDQAKNEKYRETPFASVTKFVPNSIYK